MVGGFGDCVFEIGRMFRNEGVSIKHNPEYTAFELYKLYATREEMMAIVEGSVEYANTKLNGSSTMMYQGQEFETKGPWPRISMPEAVKDKTGIDFMAITSDEDARKAATNKGFKVPPRMRWGEVINLLFEETVEETLSAPCHIIDHPLDISPLAKQKDDEPRLTSRFESFINGWEIGNGFSELNDPAEQRRRLEMQMENYDAGDDEAHQMDEDFLNALSFGMPPTGGLGMGLDRLAMLLTDTTNIRDVINFPTLRPLKEKNINKSSNATPSNTPVVDENQKRFIVAVNGKVEDPDKLMNAIGHAMAGLSGVKVSSDDAQYIDYVDGDGNVHPSISHYPVIILKAKNSNQLAKIRDEASARDIPYTDFLSTMQIGTTQEQLEATKATSGDDIDFMAVCMFGDTETLRKFTGKLSLYK